MPAFYDIKQILRKNMLKQVENWTEKSQKMANKGCDGKKRPNKSTR